MKVLAGRVAIAVAILALWEAVAAPLAAELRRAAEGLRLHVALEPIEQQVF